MEASVDMGSESSDSDSEAWVAYRAPGQTSSPRERKSSRKSRRAC